MVADDPRRLLPDGPPAFPLVRQSAEDVFEEGMTLRDYFAAHALTSFSGGRPSDETCEKMARWAYRIANAMLEERAR